MNEINQKQSSDENVKIAAAFRYAYKRAKYWKSWIWSLTLLLVFLQLLAAINHQDFKAYLPDNLAAMVVTVSLLSMLMSTLGKHYLVNKFIGFGSKLQRLHDFNILGLGTKPTVLEIRPSQVERFSKQWLDKKPSDQPNLSEWWPSSVSELPEKTGISLCLLSTFKWENELRNKYNLVLLLTGAIVTSSSFLLMHLLDYKLSVFIVNILVPLSPFLALLIDEWLVNNSCLEVARDSSQEALKLWREYSAISEKEQEGTEELNQLNHLWGGYRSTASPIFDWLYWITQKSMNRDMIIDASVLVAEYQQNHRSHQTN